MFPRPLEKILDREADLLKNRDWEVREDGKEMGVVDSMRYLWMLSMLDVVL